ncbi:MAG: hypothetical protein DWQ36_15040 [Acidobacteria bacterium]|nr:MAG: hypothetical protein DWQ36_15040 [Acidobacteriota bacterium]
MRDKYGKTAEKCAFNFPMGSLSEAAGDCRVAGMTLLGSDPAPHLVSVYRSFENVTREREVESEKGGEGWRLSGDLLACSGEVCDLDGFVQVELIRADLELSGMADCPWSHVVARLDLAQ